MEKPGNSHIVGRNKMTESCVIIVWQIFIKMKHAVPYGLAITHLGIYPSEIKIYVHTKICRKKMSAVSSFIKTRDWQQLRSCSVDKWLFILCTFKPSNIMKQLKGRYKCLAIQELLFDGGKNSLKYII